MAQTRKTAPSALEVIKGVKKKKILPLYYLFGDDTYSLNLASKTIEDAMGAFITSDFDKDVCYSDDRNLQDVLNLARAFPFGSEKKLIIYKDAEKIKDKKLLEPYISSPSDFTVLVLIHNGKIANLTSTPFKQLFENNFLFEARELKGENLFDWIVELAASKGREISNDNAALLANVSGEDRVIIENQLEKIITFLGDKTEITFNAIKEVSVSFKEHNIFDLQNAIFQKEKPASHRIALSMLDKGEDATFIINMLTRSFIGLSQLKEINEKKIPDTEAAKIIGTHPFYLKNYHKARVLFTDNDLTKAIEALLKADVSIKTTTTSPQTIISILIAELF